MIKQIAMAASAALVVASASPAFADPFAFSDNTTPHGATATINFKMALGGPATKPERASYGLTFAYGQRVGEPPVIGRPEAQALTFGDLRFNADGLERAELASFDLADLEADPRMNIFDDGNFGTTELVLIGVGAGLILALVL